MIGAIGAGVASFVALLVVAFGGTQNQGTQITAIIMAGATVIAYIAGEGLIDSASAGASVTINGDAGQFTGVQDKTPQTDKQGSKGAA